MNICFMGSMDFAVPILEGLHKKYGVSLVVTQPDKPFGRKQILKGTSVKNKALELGIELFQPVSIKKDYQRIINEDFDFIIVAAYGQMIPEVVLLHGTFQAINVHASLLPKYRGGSPMHQAIINGDAQTGVSIVYMEKSLDSGFILSQISCDIKEDMDVSSLEKTLSLLGRDLLLNTIDELLKGKVKPVAQDLAKVTYAYNFRNQDLIINFNKTAKEISDFVRGLRPWPIAYFMFEDKKIKVFEVEYQNINLSDIPGEIVKVAKDGLFVQTKSGIVNLKSIQLEGKKQMNIKDFMNGVGKSMFFAGQILK